MTPHLWWYVSRGAGITSWFFGGTSVMTGLLLSSKAALRPRPNWQLDLHRYQATLSLSMLALHLASLIADSYTHFGVREILVPAASAWKPLAVAWGVVAMYLLVAVEATSLVRTKIPKKVWRAVSKLSTDSAGTSPRLVWRSRIWSTLPTKQRASPASRMTEAPTGAMMSPRRST